MEAPLTPAVLGAGIFDAGLGAQVQLYETYCKRRATTPRAKGASTVPLFHKKEELGLSTRLSLILLEEEELP